MITSLQNPLVKRLVRLQQHRHRQQEGLFLVEGENELRHALAGGVSFQRVVVCAELLTANAHLNTLDALRQALPGGEPIDIVDVAPHVYAKLAYRQSAEGLIGVARIPQQDVDAITLPENPLVVVLEGVEKPGNLGAVLRTADAGGVDLLIVCSDRIDLYNPNVIRASIGAVFTAGTLALTTGEAQQFLAQRNITPVLSTPAGASSHTAVDFTGPVAIVLGSEAEGLSPQWLEGPGVKVCIPMHGQMDSLNLSASAAILVYEAVRQRGA